MLMKNNSSVQQLTNFGWYAISVMLGYSKKKVEVIRPYYRKKVRIWELVAYLEGGCFGIGLYLKNYGIIKRMLPVVESQGTHTNYDW